MGKPFFFDLSKFKKVASDENSTTLRNPDGHEFKIDHRKLNPKMRMALQALTPLQAHEAHDQGMAARFMAKGGSVDSETAFLSKRRELEGLQAAIRHPATGKVHTGGTHREAYAKAGIGDLSKFARHDEGFVNMKGRFLTRDEAEKEYGAGESLNLQALRRRMREEYKDGGAVIPKAEREGEETGKTVKNFKPGESYGKVAAQREREMSKGGKVESEDEILARQYEKEGLRAAIRDPKTGEIHEGEYHGAILSRFPHNSEKRKRMAELYPQHSGFVTREGKYLTRDEADARHRVMTSDDLPINRKMQAFRLGDYDEDYSKGGQVEGAEPKAAEAQDSLEEQLAKRHGVLVKHLTDRGMAHGAAAKHAFNIMVSLVAKTQDKSHLADGGKIEKHHTIGLDTIEKIDWHLRHLFETPEAEGGYRTIREMPASEHEARHGGHPGRLADPEELEAYRKREYEHAVARNEEGDRRRARVEGKIDRGERVLPGEASGRVHEVSQLATRARKAAAPEENYARGGAIHQMHQGDEDEQPMAPPMEGQEPMHQLSVDRGYREPEYEATVSRQPEDEAIPRHYAEGDLVAPPLSPDMGAAEIPQTVTLNNLPPEQPAQVPTAAPEQPAPNQQAPNTNLPGVQQQAPAAAQPAVQPQRAPIQPQVAPPRTPDEQIQQGVSLLRQNAAFAASPQGASAFVGEPAAAAQMSAIAGQTESAIRELMLTGHINEENAKVFQQYIASDAAASRKFQATRGEIAKNLDSLNAYAQSNPLNAQRYIQSMSTGSKILTGIGMLIAGLNTGNNVNPVVKYLNEQIERDVQEQRDNLGRVHTLYSDNLARLGDARQAYEMTVMQNQTLLQNQVQQTAMRHGGQMAAAKAQGLLAQAQQAIAQQAGELAMRRTMWGIGQQGGQQPQAPGARPPVDQSMLNAFRYSNDPRAKDIEARLIPDVGYASIPVSPEKRDAIQGGQLFIQQLQELKGLTEQYGGLAALRNAIPGTEGYAAAQRAETLANGVMNSYRVATGQGVYKEAQKNFDRSLIPDNAVGLWSLLDNVPKYNQMLRISQQELRAHYKALGIKTHPYQGQAVEPPSMQVPNFPTVR
jgi:hypothetical protein